MRGRDIEREIERYVRGRDSMIACTAVYNTRVTLICFDVLSMYVCVQEAKSSMYVYIYI